MRDASVYDQLCPSAMVISKNMKWVFVLCLFSITLPQLVSTKKAASLKNTTNTAVGGLSSSQVSTTSSPQIPGLRLPCSCVEGQCGCCTGVLLDRFNQKACLNMSYEPDDFSLTAQMSLNNRVLYKRTVSGKNPPPMCFRLPRFQFIRLCVEFSNIYFASRNVHLCVDMEANWEDLTLVEWSFDCIRMGASGVAVVRPEEGGGLPANPTDVVDQTDEDYDDSARTVSFHNPKRTSVFRLVFDESLKRADPRTADKKLIRVKNLSNGDVILAYSQPVSR